MRFRAAHLACVMVLLSTFGAADAYAAPGARNAAHTQAICRLLLHQAASAVPGGFSRAADAAPQPVLPGVPVAHTRPAWAMHPPAAHTAAQHAATGSGL